MSNRWRLDETSRGIDIKVNNKHVGSLFFGVCLKTCFYGFYDQQQLKRDIFVRFIFERCLLVIKALKILF
jgi:hypothetical protein